MGMIENLQAMLENGQDNALLRFSLGGQLLKAGDVDGALFHLASAVDQDPGYSAAWKLYGKALHEAGRLDQAAQAYRSGIEVAQEKGDMQAVREMTVFLKRVEKARADGNDQ